MIESLAKLILVEATVLLALSYKTVIRKPVIRALECVKHGGAQFLLFILLSTFLGLFIYTLYTIFQIYLRSIHAASINSGDQLLLVHKLLQASLIGFLLYLSMLIDRFHHLMRERSSLNKIFKAEEKQLEHWKHIIAVQARELENEVCRLKVERRKLESECHRKNSEAKAKEAIVSDLKKQSEQFSLEYDRLLEYNQTLRNQLESIDQTLLEEDKQESRWTVLKANMTRDGLNLFSWSIQEHDKNGSEVCSDSKPVTTQRCHQLLVSGTHAPSPPRHRRPIHQH